MQHAPKTHKEKLHFYRQKLAQWHRFRDRIISAYSRNPNFLLHGKSMPHWISESERHIHYIDRKMSNIMLEQKIIRHLPYAMIFLLIVVGLTFKANITGFVVKLTQDEELQFSDFLDIKYEESNQYNWIPQNPGKINSVKLSGTLLGDGRARVYLSNGDSMHVILDSTNLASSKKSKDKDEKNRTKNDKIESDNITVELSYSSGSAFDPNDDGMEDATGAIDFTVGNSRFNVPIDESGLCTRWEIYSEDELTSAYECYGAEKCCNLAELESSEPSWNAPYYVFLGKNGATETNKVRAQIIYQDDNRTENTSGIYASAWAELEALFNEIETIEFNDICEDTCYIELGNDSLFFIFELNNMSIHIMNVSYAIVPSANDSVNLTYEMNLSTNITLNETIESIIQNDSLNETAMPEIPAILSADIDDDIVEEINSRGKARVILIKRENASNVTVRGIENLAKLTSSVSISQDIMLLEDELAKTIRKKIDENALGSEDIEKLRKRISSISSVKSEKEELASSTIAGSAIADQQTQDNTLLNQILDAIESPNLAIVEQQSSGGIAVEIDKSQLEKLSQSGHFSEILLDNPVSLLADESRQITKVDAAYDLGFGGAGIKVCLIDTGIDYVNLNLTLNSTVFGYDFINNDNDPMDDNGHGTEVAYVLRKIAPGATIYMAKAVNANGLGYESDVLAGMEYCLANDADIISFSIGAGLSSGFCDSNIVAQKVNDAVAQGIFVVAATGNDYSSQIRSPSCSSNATRVAASTKQDEIAQFSNVNAIVDLFAPGVGIEIRDAVVSGSSYSSPIVAGTAAIVLGNENLSPSELKYRLRSTGDMIANLSGVRMNRVNAYNAVLGNVTNEPYWYSLLFANGTLTNFSLLGDKPKDLSVIRSITITHGPSKVIANIINISLLDDQYSTEIYWNFTRHYYYMKVLGTATLNFNIEKQHIFADFAGVKDIQFYPVMGKQTYLLENVIIERHPDYPLNDTILRIVNESRWVTMYNVSYPSYTIDTRDTREYIIGFDSDNFAGGLYNLSTPFGIVDPNVTACGTLNGANTLFTMNSSLSVGTGTCITFNASNQTFDCKNYVLSGSGTGTAFSSAQFKSTIQNCTIEGFTTNAISFNGAHNATIRNVKKNTTDAGYVLLQNAENTTVINSNFKTNSGTAGLSLVNMDFSTFQNVLVDSTGSQCLLFNTGSDSNVVENVTIRCDGSRGFQVSGGSDGNVFNNLQVLSTGTTGLFIANGGNSYSNCVINATEAGNAVQFESSASSNINFTNCTLFSHNSLAVHIGSAAGTDIIFRDNYIFANLTDSNPLILLSSATRVKFINNTIRQISQNRTLVKITGTSSGNTFELNRFGNTTDFYINVTSTGAGNSFNGSTFTGVNQGNIYPDVENGSVNITGVTDSSLTGYYIGNNGSDSPYNDNSSIKIYGGQTDFAPLTPFWTITTCDCPPSRIWSLPSTQCKVAVDCDLGGYDMVLYSANVTIDGAIINNVGNVIKLGGANLVKMNGGQIINKG